MTGAVRADQRVTLFGGQVGQHRLDAIERLPRTAGHQEVTGLKPPHTTAHAHVQEGDVSPAAAFGMAERVGIVGCRRR